MKIKISLVTIFALSAAMLTYISVQTDSIYVSNNHEVIFGLNPCNVAAEYVMMELDFLTLVATLLLLLFLFPYYIYNSRCGPIGHVLSTAMLVTLILLSASPVDLHLTGIVVL